MECDYKQVIKDEMLFCNKQRMRLELIELYLTVTFLPIKDGLYTLQSHYPVVSFYDSILDLNIYTTSNINVGHSGCL